jgi:hypothetical protein
MAMSNIELSQVFLWELRKAMAAGKKKALAASKANTMSTSTFERQSGESVSIRVSPQAKGKLMSSQA